MEAKNKPVARFTAHPVEVAVWENERVADGGRVVEYAVTIGATYKDAEGALRTARSFRPDELPNVLYAVAQALATLLHEQLGIGPEGGA